MMTLLRIVGVLAALSAPGHAWAGILERDTVESFADEVIGQAAARGDIPGAVLAVVQDGEVLLLKGYGYADLEKGIPMNPRSTLVRTGSIGKVFTAIAILQLVERGRLSMDEDVNAYLKSFQVPATFPEPVRLRHLLSHTAGFTSEVTYTVFDEGSGGQIQTAPEQLLRELVRVRPPGQVFAYDNLGLGILGFVLRDVYGSSNNEVISKHILKPLGMTETLMGIPEGRAGDFATCHDRQPDGNWAPCRYQVFRDIIEGAGNVSPTVADMAKFMIAMLKKGEYEGGRLLTPEMFDEYTNVDLHRHHPRLPGAGWIIDEKGPVGRGGLGHLGGSRGTLSNLLLYPEGNFGFFLSVNGSISWPEDDLTFTGILEYSLSGYRKPAFNDYLVFVTGFHEQFLDHMLPDDMKVPKYTSTVPEAERFGGADLARLAGRYFPTYSITHNSFAARFMMPFAVEATRVAMRDGGALVIDGAGPYVQTQPRLFEHQATGDKVAFKIIDAGVFMGRDSRPDIQVPWHAQRAVNTYPMFVFLLVLATGAVPGVRAAGGKRRLGLLASISALVFSLGVIFELEYAIRVIVIDAAPLLAALWRVPLQLAILGFVGVAIMAPMQLRSHMLGRGGAMTAGHAHTALMGLASVGLLVLAGYWGLLGRLTGN